MQVYGWPGMRGDEGTVTRADLRVGIQDSDKTGMDSCILIQENNNEYTFTWISLTFLNKEFEEWDD